MIPRLSTNLLIGALVRKAEAEGGFAAVLSKGDESSGSILVILTEKGTNPRLYERLLGADGLYSWQLALTAETDKSLEMSDFLARRRRFDPDLWVIELDVPSAERFAADMNSVG
ncbi:DUF1491 family protein [Sphingomonas parva]|uniref:DUF1491 family protein n=1 Tax=Sphingomonas parva TaxID=2555898 RepID=A0A4Y8ZVM7_9SPHN|nr:DUF1491 family protein [Sphingomonas parva]TFI59527.1 DUF1491 family protein [Sphingomonas parva]